MNNEGTTMMKRSLLISASDNLVRRDGNDGIASVHRRSAERTIAPSRSSSMPPSSTIAAATNSSSSSLLDERSRAVSSTRSTTVGNAMMAAATTVNAAVAERHEEYRYLNLIKEVMNNGSLRGNRTGTDAISTFGTQMRFSLRNGRIPVFTTKRVAWKAVVEELLWFVRGCTNANELNRRGVKIWNANGSREFLDSRGFHEREVGDLGPVYGFQWRHFGAQYKTMHDDYKNQGVDQLKDIIEKLKNNPLDRRILMSAWNPMDLDKMALPPCHTLVQFYAHDGKLSAQMYQRSADLALGVPFNVASYSLLVHMIARVCNLEPEEFVHVMGDTHIYVNHVEPLRQQLQREPRDFPSLLITRDVKDIDDFRSEDFRLLNYRPHPTIPMVMAV